MDGQEYGSHWACPTYHRPRSGRTGVARHIQAGCRCTACRGAKAAYEAAYRRDKQRGIPRLGAIVRPTELMKRVKQLIVEQVNVAAALGLGSTSIEGIWQINRVGAS
jgi:hypothetical protein